MPPKKGGKEKAAAADKAAAKGGLAAAAMKAAGGKPPPPKKIPPPPAIFNFDDIMKYKEMFKAYDEDGIEKIPLKVIPTMLRKLGFNPKTEELNELYEQILEDEFVDMVEFHEWLRIIEGKIGMGDDFEVAICHALAALSHDDEEKGVCDFEVLRQELFTWGEPFTEIEFVDWIRMATRDKTLNVDTGKFTYLKFVEHLNNKDVKFFPEPVNFFRMDQKTLAAMAVKKALEEKELMEKKEADKKAREEAKRQKMIQEGLILPDDVFN